MCRNDFCGTSCGAGGFFTVATVNAVACRVTVLHVTTHSQPFISHTHCTQPPWQQQQQLHYSTTHNTFTMPQMMRLTSTSIPDASIRGGLGEITPIIAKSIQYSPQSTCSYLITQLDLSSVLYVHIRRLKLTLSAAYKYGLVVDITPAAYASLSTEYWTISGSKLMTISECLPVRLRCIFRCWWSPNDADRFG